MSVATFFVGMLVWLQFKHFVADYLLQPAWIIRGKGDFRKPGGYIHAGVHACGSMPVLYLGGSSGLGIASLAAAEFVIHYLVDHLKAIDSRRRPRPTTTKGFWALHGFDQFLHHLTYSGMLFVILTNGAKAL
jgi:hypothetical protein